MKKFNPETIRIGREVLGLTIDEIASKLDVSRQTVYNWEQGKHVPDSNTLATLAMLLNITSMDFFYK